MRFQTHSLCVAHNYTQTHTQSHFTQQKKHTHCSLSFFSRSPPTPFISTCSVNSHMDKITVPCFSLLLYIFPVCVNIPSLSTHALPLILSLRDKHRPSGMCLSQLTSWLLGHFALLNCLPPPTSVAAQASPTSHHMFTL